VISIGAGIAPLRITEHAEPTGKVKKQDETLTDLIAASAGVVLGQRGRGVPVVIVRGVDYETSDAGVLSMIHRPR
jgi:coenzyme F420-0:L-glutamate ligase/coenzyme F420-1:gamma-L-glutamate ligase